MPDVAVHAAFGREVLESWEKEHPGVVISRDPFTFALFGPDVWFLYQPWKRREGRGRRMHTTRPGDFLMALARRAKISAHPQDLFSYLAGFLCHYALDAETHPYIIHVTEEQYHFPRCHMSFEHSLDVREMERAGVWGEKHPVTDHYFPKISLPETIREDLDQVFVEVYGWKHCWRALNSAAGRYRLCYRFLENRKGLVSRLARGMNHPLLKSLTYSESHFNGHDVENREGREWAHSHEPSLRSRAGFDELRQTAKKNAGEMILAAYRFIFLSEITEEELARVIGNRSYLSGLPAEDPRNHAVSSLLPPEKALKKKVTE